MGFDGVVSLADLLAYNVELMHILASALGGIKTQPFLLDDSARTDLMKTLARAQRVCMDHGWMESAHQINQVGEYIGDPLMMPLVLQSKCSDLEQHLLRVFNDNLFFHAESEHLKDYQTEGEVAKIWKDDFPLAYFESYSMRKCYLFGEPTASVFHSMRMLEIGLRAFAKVLNVPVTTRDQWEVIINNIETEIKKISGPQAGADWKQKQEAYSEAALHFRYLKNAWRNHVSHARVSYEPPKALQIMRHVCEFIKELKSIGLKEPLADAMMQANDETK
jgi:hypothetical protein